MLRFAEPLGIPGDPYLVRWVLGISGIGSIRLHHWLASDDNRNPHDHSWSFITLILRGRYFDATPVWGKDGKLRKWDYVESKAGWLYYRNRDHVHYVAIIPGEECWSILLTGPKSRAFGFWVSMKKRLKANKYFLSFGHHSKDGESPRRTRKVREGFSETVGEIRA